MDPKELLNLLDLQRPANDAAASNGSRPPVVESESPTAFEMDAWGLRRGNELHSACERLASLDLDAFAIADCHAAAFDPEPRLQPRCRDARHREFFSTLLETSEYRSLHESTKLDVCSSEIAAVHFAEELSRYRKDAYEDQSPSGIEKEIAALRAASRAVRSASEEVDACRDAVAALGMGPGSPGHNDARAIADVFRRVRNDPQLRKICNLAGRYRRLAQSRQRRKTRHGLDDVVGVELSGDLGRILPHEAMLLATPPFDLDAMRRFTERQLMSREHRSTDAVGKGPIVVVVDESGSMASDPIHAAKAIALALAWIARQQNRWCALVAYSGDSGERLLRLPVGRWDENALADWLIDFIGRGSTLDVPVRELPRMMADLGAPRGDTDVIAITDCICQIPEPVGDDFLAWKKTESVWLMTIVIGQDAGDLIRISDEVHFARSLAIEEEAVARVLSI